MPGETWAGSGVRFVAMWLVMMVAMMLPPLVPMLASFRRNRLAALQLEETRGTTTVGT